MWPASKDLIPSALEELKKEVMSVPVWIPEIEFLEEEKNEEIDRTNKIYYQN